MTAQALYVKLKRKPFLKTKIVLLLYYKCRGKSRAIKRKNLLRFCRIFDGEISDREMRKIYSSLNVCACNEGVFWPVRPREIEGFRLYMRNKVFPQFRRYKRVMEAHKKLARAEAFEYQMELF